MDLFEAMDTNRAMRPAQAGPGAARAVGEARARRDASALGGQLAALELRDRHQPRGYALPRGYPAAPPRPVQQGSGGRRAGPDDARRALPDRALPRDARRDLLLHPQRLPECRDPGPRDHVVHDLPRDAEPAAGRARPRPRRGDDHLPGRRRGTRSRPTSASPTMSTSARPSPSATRWAASARSGASRSTRCCTGSAGEARHERLTPIRTHRGPRRRRRRHHRPPQPAQRLGQRGQLPDRRGAARRRGQPGRRRRRHHRRRPRLLRRRRPQGGVHAQRRRRRALPGGAPGQSDLRRARGLLEAGNRGRQRLRDRGRLPDVLLHGLHPRQHRGELPAAADQPRHPARLRRHAAPRALSSVAATRCTWRSPGARSAPRRRGASASSSPCTSRTSCCPWRARRCRRSSPTRRRRCASRASRCATATTPASPPPSRPTSSAR